MKIIVTGSLGHIGKPLATELAQKGHQVTVISSKAERQKDIEALGATAAIGSLEDVKFLVSIFTDADAVFAMKPPNFTVPDVRAYYRNLGDNYAEAIQETGIKRVVHLSSYGAHLDKGTGFILGSYDVEGVLNKLSDVVVTHLRPGYFYYNLYNYAAMIKQAGFIGSNYGGDDEMILVDPVDIAAVAAEELEKHISEKVRYIASEESTCNQIARVLGAAIGKPDLKWVTFTDDETQKALQERGVPPHIAAQWVELGAAIHHGKLQEDYELNKPAAQGRVKLEDFAKEFAAAYEKQIV